MGFNVWRRALRKQTEEEDYLGQNRVFLVRDFGIVTHWYLTRRCEEECNRAERYGRPLSLLLVQPLPEADNTSLHRRLREAFGRGSRKADVAGYLGDSCYAVLLPETDSEKAGQLADRLRRAVQQVETGVSSFPEDGSSLQDLTTAARRQFGQAAAAA